MRSRLLACGIIAVLLVSADSKVLPLPMSPKAQGGPELPRDDGKAEANSKKERESLAREREESVKEMDSGSDSLSVERAKLRAELRELLKKINERKSAPAETEPRVVFPKSPDEEATRPLDPLNQAQSLYRQGNFDASLRAFRLVDTSALTAEDRSFVQYMIASCLRRLGKTSDASDLYREVADAHEDAFIAECAVWQLSNLRWRRDLETQLEDLRQRRKAR
jgi:hypothetical protein